MPEHKLQAGRLLIDGLKELGVGLGYYVQGEHPVRKSARTPPAIDVAWMADETQKFPLMVFEIESSASNSMANNVVKVFGQSTDTFEKPLFFFHVIIDSGGDTSRVESLKLQFGLNNYRLYRLDHRQKTQLICDVLSQHRRIRAKLDVRQLFALLSHKAWRDVDPIAVVNQIERSQYDAQLLRDYGRLALINHDFVSVFVARLAVIERGLADTGVEERYETYIGDWWARPIHLAILSRTSPEMFTECFRLLKEWQDSNSYRSRIGPHFGLSRDYDEFILFMAAGLLGAVGAIFQPSAQVRGYLAKIMMPILDRLASARPNIFAYHASWLLHLSAGGDDLSIFDRVRDMLDQKGGVNRLCVLNPPFQLPADDDDQEGDWNERLEESAEPTPSLEEFISLVRSPVGLESFEAIELGIRLLVEFDFNFDPTQAIFQGLHQ